MWFVCALFDVLCFLLLFFCVCFCLDVVGFGLLLDFGMIYLGCVVVVYCWFCFELVVWVVGVCVLNEFVGLADGLVLRLLFNVVDCCSFVGAFIGVFVAWLRLVFVVLVFVFLLV